MGRVSVAMADAMVPAMVDSWLADRRQRKILAGDGALPSAARLLPPEHDVNRATNDTGGTILFGACWHDNLQIPSKYADIYNTCTRDPTNGPIYH